MINTIDQFFQACHPFGYPLLACSVIMFATILYHLLFGAKWHGITRLEKAAAGGDTALLQYCRNSQDELSGTAAFILQHREDSHLEQQVEARLGRYVDSCRAGLSTISIITNIAPMLGILGTAWGLVDIFGVFGTPGAESGISIGISKALYTTIFGLAIAVPGTIALVCFERRLERNASRINLFFTQLLARSKQS